MTTETLNDEAATAAILEKFIIRVVTKATIQFPTKTTYYIEEKFRTNRDTTNMTTYVNFIII